MKILGLHTEVVSKPKLIIGETFLFSFLFFFLFCLILRSGTDSHTHTLILPKSPSGKIRIQPLIVSAERKAIHEIEFLEILRPHISVKIGELKVNIYI